MGESPSQCNLLFYFVLFVFFVDELPFLGSTLYGSFGKSHHQNNFTDYPALFNQAVRLSRIFQRQLV
jgi:hypothetical protein